LLFKRKSKLKEKEQLESEEVERETDTSRTVAKVVQLGDEEVRVYVAQLSHVVCPLICEDISE